MRAEDFEFQELAEAIAAGSGIYGIDLVVGSFQGTGPFTVLIVGIPAWRSSSVSVNCASMEIPETQTQASQSSRKKRGLKFAGLQPDLPKVVF